MLNINQGVLELLVVKLILVDSQVIDGGTYPALLLSSFNAHYLHTACMNGIVECAC